jgi:hypothetical protein
MAFLLLSRLGKVLLGKRYAHPISRKLKNRLMRDEFSLPLRRLGMVYLIEEESLPSYYKTGKWIF